MSLVPVDTTSELAVTSYLQQARDWLTRAVDETGPEQIAAAKAEIATAAEATKQLGLSKDIQLDAQEMVRRAEYALGKAIRKGQAEGTILPKRGRPASGSEQTTSKVGDYLPHEGSVRQEIYAMTDSLDADGLDEVLADAKSAGNLSRANVVRLAREKSASPAPAPTGTTERNHQEAELVNAVASVVRPLTKANNVSTLSPKARTRLIQILEAALETLKEGTS